MAQTLRDRTGGTVHPGAHGSRQHGSAERTGRLVKLARVGVPGAEQPVAVLDDGRLVDLSSVTADIDPEFVAAVALGAGPDPARLADLPTVEPGRYGPPLH